MSSALSPLCTALPKSVRCGRRSLWSHTLIVPSMEALTNGPLLNGPNARDVIRLECPPPLSPRHDMAFPPSFRSQTWITCVWFLVTPAVNSSGGRAL